MTTQQEVKRFSVHYGAAKDSALDKHKMNAYNLGMLIVEFAKMVNRADDIINKTSTLELEVIAPAKEGSLIVEFALLIKNSGALEVMKYLGISTASASVLGGSALGIAKKLKDKRILGINTDTKTNTSTILLDGEMVTSDRTVASLVSDPVIRQAMNEIITQPLLSKNEPSFKIKVENEEVVSFKGEEVLDFTPLPKASLSSEITKAITTNVLLTQVNFDSSRGWKMKYDGKERSVRMDDASFMSRVKHSEKSFTKGDMFEVALSIVSKTTARSQKTDYVITRVIRHRASTDRKIV